MNRPEIRTPEDDFRYFVQDPTQWLSKGQTLYRGAMHLFERFKEAFETLDKLDGVSIDETAAVFADQQLFESAGMLAGFSLEVTIKAAIVANHPDRIKRGMRGTDWMEEKRASGHDLMALARAAEIDPIDTDLLEILTKFSIWKGRYPSNLQGTPMYGMQVETENFGGNYWVELIDRFERAYQGIRAQAKAATIGDAAEKSER